MKKAPSQEGSTSLAGTPDVSFGPNPLALYGNSDKPLFEYDVIIIGAGIIGASTADALARRGYKPLLLEQYTPAHEGGSSHGDGRILRYDHSETIYTDMVKMSFAAWEDVERRSGKTLLKKTSCCNIGPLGGTHLYEIEANFKKHGLTYERLSADESNRRFKQLHIDADSEVLYQPDAAVINASLAVNTLCELAKDKGANVVTGEKIVHMNVEANTVMVRSKTGNVWTAPKLVLAAGGWTGKLLEQLGLELTLNVTQEQVAFFAAKAANTISHRVGDMPIVLDHTTGSQPFFCLPQNEVAGVKAGWHHTGPVIDPDKPQSLNEDNLSKLANEFIQKRLPHLDPVPIETQTCLYTNSFDRHFIIDHHPEYPHVTIATGFSGHGFKFGPVVGEMVTSLVFNQPQSLKTDMFLLNRFEHEELLVPRTNA